VQRNPSIVSLAAALALALLLTSGPRAAQKKPPPPPAPFYPLKAGDTWEYRRGQQKLTTRVVREEALGADTYAVLETTADGKTVLEKIAALPNGVYRAFAEDLSIEPPLCILKLPVKAGETWIVKCKAGGLPIDGTFTVREEDVKVPAGAFKTVRSTSTDFRIGTLKMSLSYWFAPGVGLVKQRLQLGDRDEVFELEKFTPAK
jgi:hypothetical protein